MTAQVGGTTLSPDLPSKPDLRKIMRKRRIAVAPRTRRHCAERCAKTLAAALRHRRARCVAVYLAYGAELSTTPLITSLLDLGIAICVPRISRGSGMRFVELDASTPLRRNRFGIPEPTAARRVALNRIDALVMPLTAFDAQGHRLGTGGGYYDRLLASTQQRRKPWRVGYAYAFQQVDALPVEPWDIHLHAVCTESGLRRCDPIPEPR